MIIALLGVLKAGGAYVPLDPDFPADRLAYMVEDSQASVFISQQGIIEKFSDLDAEVILLDSESTLFSNSDHCETPESPVSSTDLAYVIYTSGSTGKPKGVQLTQRSLVNFLHSMGQAPGISADDIFHSLTTVCFDIAALEIFLPLINGAQLVIKSREISLDPSQLLESLNTSGATMLQATPVTWRMLLAHGWQGDPKLTVLCGGEAMGIDLAQQLINTGCNVWNLYGPTETTIWSSARLVKTKENAQFVGQPIANTEFLVCSPQLTLQPIGVPGELLIGGEGLARGYLHRDELTQEKFIPHPFEPSAKLYRTGDLVVRRSNGELEFLGRMDNQVKIRGFRIELGEIETRLSNYNEVNQCVVIAREDIAGDKRLVAYATAQTEGSIDASELLTRLREELPDYMVPSSLVELSTFPLTPNGKVDRKKLPAPSDQASPDKDEIVPPRNDFERSILTVWQRALKTTAIGITDNFFHVGGHSLLAVSVVKDMMDATGVEFDIGVLFNYPTITALTESLGENAETASSNVVLLRESTLSPEEKKAPLFLLCGVDLYQDLANTIEGRDVYGVYVFSELAMVRDALAGEKSDVSFDLLCDHYMEAVTRFNPDGPYLLGGVSFGGFIAIEVARRIREQGKPVDSVFLMDTVIPGTTKKNYRKYFLHHVFASPASLARKVINKINIALKDTPPPASASAPDNFDEQRRIRNRKFLEIMRRQKLTMHKYSGDVVLFRAKDRGEGSQWMDADATLGWSNVVDGNLDVVDVDGDHLGILEPENSTAISTRINRFGALN